MRDNLGYEAMQAAAQAARDERSEPLSVWWSALFVLGCLLALIWMVGTASGAQFMAWVDSL